MEADFVVFTDIFLNHPPQLPWTMVLTNVQFLCFQTAEPTLNHNVVRPTGFSVHTLTDPALLQQGLVFLACELGSLVTVDDGRYPMGFDSGPYGFYNTGGVQTVRETVSHYFSAAPVDDSSQIHMASVQRDIGDINRPNLIGKGGVEIPE